MKRQIEGTADNLRAALDDAVQKAIDTITTTDAMISWKLLQVTGERGGVASIQTVTVTLEY